MRKLFCILSISLLFSVLSLSAQNISGRILSESGQALEFVNIVAISSLDSAFVEGTTSAEDGTFTLKTQPQRQILLKLSSVGYEMRILSSTDDLSALILKEDAQTLSETVITAQKALVKTEADRTTYDVKEDEDAKTKTILELLRKVPYVSVDAQGNITIKGSGNIQIYENGRLNNSYTSNPKTILTSIPASTVDHFEVITAPGAKYDAEGVDGILNIVMRKDNVISGVAGQGGVQYTAGQGVGILYLGAKAGKVDLSVHYNGVRLFEDNMKQVQDFDIRYQTNGNHLHMDQTVSTPGWGHVMGLESSWQIDSLNLISASLDGVAYKVKVNGQARTRLEGSDGSLIYQLDDNFDDSNQNHYDVNAKVDYQHQSARHKGEMLTLSYLLSTSDTHYQMGERYSNIQGQDPGYRVYFHDNDGLFVEHTFQADYQRPFDEHHSMNVGLKYIIRSNSAKAEGFYDQERLAWSDFSHITDVGAAYAEYNLKTGALSLNTGLRYELAHLKARFNDKSQEDFSKNIGDVVPFLSLGLSLSEKHALSFNYASRVERPGITYLNPFREETITSINEGNPNLKSSRPSKLTLGYNFISPKLQMGLNLDGSFVNDGIAALISVEGDRVYRSYGNVAKITQTGMSGFMRYQPFPGTDLTLSLLFFNSRYKNRNLGLDNCHKGWSGNLSLSQQLPLDIRLSADVSRNDVPVSSLYSVVKPYYQTSLGLMRTFLKNRLVASIELENIFLGKYLNYQSANRQGDYVGVDKLRLRHGFVGFSLVYRFGNMGSQVQKTKKTIENDDLVGNK